MSVLYHPRKSNVVADALSRSSKGSVPYVEEVKKELAHEMHHLARLGVRLLNLAEDNVWVQSSSESSLVSEVKEKQDMDSRLIKLKESVKDQKVEVFSQGGDGILRLRGRLCVPDFDDLR